MNELERYMFDVQGFLVLRGVLTRDEVADLVKVFDAGIDEGGSSVTPMADGSVRTQNFLQWGQPVRDLLDHPVVSSLFDELLGGGYRIDHYYGMKQPKGTGLAPLHGGGFNYTSTDYYDFRNGRMHSGLAVASWVLTDSPPDSGGFVCIPGSHKANLDLPGFRDHFHKVELMSFDDNPHLVQRVQVNAGDLIFFTEALCHGAEAWSLDEPRRALLYKYSPAAVAWSPAAQPPPDVMEMLTPAQQVLFLPPYVHPPRVPAEPGPRG